MIKTNKILIILTIILAITTISFGVYILYDKVLNNTDSENKYSYNLSKRKYAQVINGNDGVNVIVDTDGNVYLYFDGISNSSDLKNSNITLDKNLFKNYSPKNVYQYNSSESIYAVKLNVEKVLTGYYNFVGNGGFSFFIFVKENGDLSYLVWDAIVNKGQIIIQDFDNLKNISFVTFDDYYHSAYAVDIDGKETELQINYYEHN